MKQDRATTVSITYHDDRTLPSFHEDAASVYGEGIRISRCVSSPFVYYIFDSQKQGPNGSFIMTVDVQPSIKTAIADWRKEEVTNDTATHDAR